MTSCGAMNSANVFEVGNLVGLLIFTEKTAEGGLYEELVAKTLQHVEVMYMRELEYEIICRLFFAAIRKFLLGNRDKCLAFIRYYYFDDCRTTRNINILS